MNAKTPTGFYNNSSPSGAATSAMECINLKAMPFLNRETIFFAINTPLPSTFFVLPFLGKRMLDWRGTTKPTRRFSGGALKNGLPSCVESTRCT